jgi:hypothetical protein
MMTKATPGKSAAKDGYFADFNRTFEKEPLHDAVRGRRQEALKKKTRMLAGPYKPASPVKKMGSSGSHAGTFSGVHKYFSREEARKGPAKKESRNFLTNPGKEGSGYGFPNVTIGKAPEYKTSAYNAQQTQARKDAATHRRAVRGGPFKAAAPDAPQGAKGFFEPNPFVPSKVQGKPKAQKPAAKITVPFYPNKPLGTMESGGNNHSTFAAFTYVGEKAKARPSGPKPPAPVFKPVSNVKSAPSSSVVVTNVKRSVNMSNASRISVL